MRRGIVAFLALLQPHLGGLLVPVALYGLVLGVMAAIAGGLGGLIAVGGALFVVSDSVLALGRFLPGYEFAAHDLVVMSTYLAAQGLIALGVVRVHRRTVSSVELASTASIDAGVGGGRRSPDAGPPGRPRSGSVVSCTRSTSRRHGPVSWRSASVASCGAQRIR